MGERDWIAAGARISYGGCPPKQDGQHSLAGRADEALETGRDALEIAEALGLDDIRANVLSTSYYRCQGDAFFLVQLVF